GTRLPAADRLPAERHPLRRSLAPLRPLVLLPDGRAGRVLPLVVPPAHSPRRRLAAAGGPGAAGVPLLPLLDGGHPGLLQPLAGQAVRLRADDVAGHGPD